MKYVALLRGINVGGKNKVSMSDLRECFESAGFTDVSTYINSGNVLFDSDETDTVRLVSTCERTIETRFGFPVVVMVVSADDLRRSVKTAPSWWAEGDPKEFRHDALFVIPPTTSAEVLEELTKRPSEVDKLEARDHVVFWTLKRSDYGRSKVPKMIGTDIHRRVTMRGASTTKKLIELLDQ